MYISHSPTEAHCPVDSACLNQKIEAKTVKNLRVVVTVTRVSAEKERTKKKMKNWPVDVCACMYVCVHVCMYEVVVTLTRVSAEKERAKKHTCHYVYTI